MRILLIDGAHRGGRMCGEAGEGGEEVLKEGKNEMKKW